MRGKDQAVEFLRRHGCPEHVVRGGLRGLMENWQEVVRSVEEGYSLGLDDYLNDMDGRQLLDEALHVLPAADRKPWLRQIRQADAKMQTLVQPVGRCLWGDETAKQEGWTARKNWWYFSRPIRAGENLLAEIEND